MDFVGLLLSLNKISLAAFLITSGFVGYQVYLLVKESKKNKKTVSVPDFKATPLTNMKQKGPIIGAKAAAYTRVSFIPIIIGMILLIIFAIIFLIGMVRSNEQANRDQVVIPTPIITYVASKGIKMYGQNWKELTDNDLSNLKQAETIYIGIATVSGADIDSARIRINKSTWDKNDITLDFNKQLGVYYRSYTIATGSSSLRVEAELHSLKDGWLGD